MVNYYDCSINELSNHHHIRSNMGPKENDIMRGLATYAANFGYKRVYNYEEANIVITNTTYTDDILNWCDKNNIPKVKRMDGIYWKNDIKYKNDSLNIAAQQSDIVIFISEYSRRALRMLYNYTPSNNYVIVNDVDELIFYPMLNKCRERFTSISSCTNWNRSEKRLVSIIDLAVKNPQDDFLLIGLCDQETPPNIQKIGYIDDQSMMSEIISSADIFIAPFYRDAAPKVVSQAVKCGLPILYSSSGGIGELVGEYGIKVLDDESIRFDDLVPDLDMSQGYKKIKNLNKLEHKTSPYILTIKKYFEVFNYAIRSC